MSSDLQIVHDGDGLDKRLSPLVEDMLNRSGLSSNEVGRLIDLLKRFQFDPSLTTEKSTFGSLSSIEVFKDVHPLDPQSSERKREHFETGLKSRLQAIVAANFADRDHAIADADQWINEVWDYDQGDLRRWLTDEAQREWRYRRDEIDRDYVQRQIGELNRQNAEMKEIVAAARGAQEQAEAAAKKSREMVRAARVDLLTFLTKTYRRSLALRVSTMFIASAIWLALAVATAALGVSLVAGINLPWIELAAPALTGEEPETGKLSLALLIGGVSTWFGSRANQTRQDFRNLRRVQVHLHMKRMLDGDDAAEQELRKMIEEDKLAMYQTRHDEKPIQGLVVDRVAGKNRKSKTDDA